jgi:serine/threonine-protein kinase RsbW
VSLELPASPEYLGVIRLVSAGLAAPLGFTLEAIEDLKIAVDELTAYVIRGKDPQGRLELSFRVGDDRIEITGSRRSSDERNLRIGLTELSRLILETVADEASLQQEDGVPTFKIVKRARS